MKSNLALFYPIDYNCLCDPGFLVTNLGKQMTLKWPMLGSIYNSIHFSQNFISCKLFYFWSIFCIYPGQVFYHDRHFVRSSTSCLRKEKWSFQKLREHIKIM